MTDYDKIKIHPLLDAFYSDFYQKDTDFTHLVSLPRQENNHHENPGDSQKNQGIHVTDKLKKTRSARLKD